LEDFVGFLSLFGGDLVCKQKAMSVRLSSEQKKKRWALGESESVPGWCFKAAFL
jgi:hypothetical protein